MVQTIGIGRHVKIHSLASEKAKRHNGKTAVVKSIVSECRLGVQPMGDPRGKILAIKPSNLTILCSFCKMKEEQTAPQPIICQRCQKESYCSEKCKKRHWEGANKESEVPNSHKIWCIPIKFEMEVPANPVGESNVGEDIYELVAQYLQKAADIGNSGRVNEERVMHEKLLEVDPHQPSAYYNLFHCCVKLATFSERYYPDAYEVMEFKAINYLTMGIELVVSQATPGGHLDGPIEQLFKVLIDIINDCGLKFIEGCMCGERGAGNAKLERIKKCLEKILLLFDQRNESPYVVHATLGFCCQKLYKYMEAIDHFDQCCKTHKDRHWYRVSFMQIPLCLSSMALSMDEKEPNERVSMMEGAVNKFKEALEITKAEDPATTYMCQANLCRTLFNQNSMLNEFAKGGAIEYSKEQKEELFSTFSTMAADALQGAIAAGNRTEVESIQSVQRLPFV